MKREQTPNKKRRYNKAHEDEPQEVTWKNMDVKELLQDIDEIHEEIDMTLEDINRLYL